MSWLHPFMFDALAQPYWLLLALPVILLLFGEWVWPRPGSLRFSTVATLEILPRRGSLLRYVPPLLRAGGLLLLIMALAGPLHGFQVRKDRTNVVDIMLCLDVSGSMQQTDFVVQGEYKDRLYVAKEAVRQFIQNRKQVKTDRFGVDRIGLILFAGYAWTQCPLTLDYGILEYELERAQSVAGDRRKDGTAIGSALGLAVRRLSQSEAKSKVVVLLTDGLNNAGELDPRDAAKIAKENNVRVYTIGAGTTEGGVLPAPFLSVRQAQPIDEGMLTEIAQSTGGRYYRATDTESLQRAYEEIDQLEATEVEGQDYYEYREAYHPWLWAGATAVLLSLFLRRFWLEPVP